MYGDDIDWGDLSEDPNELADMEDNRPGSDIEGAPVPPQPPAEVVEWKTVKLKADEEELTRRRQEDEREGVDRHDYECPLCEVGNMTEETDNVETAEMMRKIYETYNRSYSEVSAEHSYKQMAKAFNKTIWKDNEQRGKNKDKLKKWNRVIVRNHMEHHRIGKPTKKIDENLKILGRIKDEIRYNGLVQTRHVNGEARETALEKTNLNNLLRLMMVEARLINVKIGMERVTNGKDTAGNKGVKRTMDLLHLDAATRRPQNSRSNVRF